MVFPEIHVKIWIEIHMKFGIDMEASNPWEVPQIVQVMDGHFSIETNGDLGIPHDFSETPIMKDTARLGVGNWGIASGS